MRLDVRVAGCANGLHETQCLPGHAGGVGEPAVRGQNQNAILRVQFAAKRCELIRAAEPLVCIHENQVYPDAAGLDIIQHLAKPGPLAQQPPADRIVTVVDHMCPLIRCSLQFDIDGVELLIGRTGILRFVRHAAVTEVRVRQTVVKGGADHYALLAAYHAKARPRSAAR